MERKFKKLFLNWGSLKAPGPDGMNGLFDHENGCNIKDVFQEVQKFFESGTLNPELNKDNRLHSYTDSLASHPSFPTLKS